MNWVDTVLKNKLIVYILAIALCLLGLFCLYTVPISPFPDLPSKQISIRLAYPGANAGTVESQVTSKIARALQSVSNVDHMIANSGPGSASITLSLDSTDTQDMTQTQIDVMQAISSTSLPSSVPQPIINTATSQSGLLFIIVRSDTLPVFDIDNFIQSTLYPKFSTLPGVSAANNSENPVVNIHLMPEMLAQYQLDATTVSELIDSQFESTPLGSLYLNKHTYQLGVDDNINSLHQFDNLIVGTKPGSGQPVYLKDIATIAFEPQSLTENSYSAFNGQASGGIELYTSSRANPFLVSKTAKQYINTLNNTMPDGMKILPLFDAAQNMHTSINEVAFTILIASILVLLIALIFLGHLRTTLIPIITIPICLLGSVVFVNGLGMTLNILTLLAMVISVGLVVDDAIVVVENITRHLEKGMTKYDAVLHGTSDIALTILGITATLMAVYLPITFSSGPFIVMLAAFALPLAAAVFISGVVALTLTPIMCMALIVDHEQNSYQRWLSAKLNKVIIFYQKCLSIVLNKPKISLLVIIILISSGGYFALNIPQEVFPSDPNGTVHVDITGASDASVDSLKIEAAKFKTFYSSDKIEYYMTTIREDGITGRLTAMLELNYKDKYLHQTTGIADKINQYIKANNIHGAHASIEKVSNWGSGADVSFYLYGSGDIKNINTSAGHLEELINKSDTFLQATANINEPQKQIAFNIDYPKAAKLGIYKNQITTLLSTYYGGYTLTNNLSIAGLSVPVVAKIGNKDLQDAASLQKIQIQSPTTGKFYSINEFVSLKTVAKPMIITTFNGQSAVEIDASLATGQEVASGIKTVNKLIASNMPNLQYQYTGNAESYLESSHESALVYGLGILCIYFLLTILFKSILDPLIIMLTVPFSIIGGALCLYLVGGTINLYSTLGLITLIGLITKHGVLIVQFANDGLSHGMTVKDSIMRATHHRFRPIIMTTLAMAFGVVPLVLSQEMMYVAREALGTVIIGGLFIGTFFSLFIVPLVYTLAKKQLAHND